MVWRFRIFSNLRAYLQKYVRLLTILGLRVCRLVEMEVVQVWHSVSRWAVVVELVLLFGCCGPLHAAKPNSSLKKCLMSVYGKRTKGGQVVRSVCL